MQQEIKAQPDELSVNDFVSWDSSGGRARGQVERIERDGTIDVPDSEFTIEGTEDDPAALIRIFRDSEPTDILVGHRFSTLDKISPIKVDSPDGDSKATDEEIAERYDEYKATVNMSASELEAWAETDCSKEASDSRAPIERNLRLLRTNKDEWGNKEYDDAGRTISFVSRMRGNNRGEPVNENCPSKRDISLKNWAFDPNKSKSMNGKTNIGDLYNYKKPDETKHFDFIIKEQHLDEVNKTATIEGYGAVFGNVDLGNDMIQRGAFSKTLADKGNKVYFLADHQYNTDSLLGVATVEEDEVGLLGKFEINLETQKGREAYSQAKQMARHGIPLGLSIGFDIMEDDMDKKTQIRLLKQIRLHEISLTPFPMNQEARVTSAKAQNKELAIMQDLLDSLKSMRPSADISAERAEATITIENLIKSLKDERNKKLS